jgi:bacillithiol biosynthesis cysteine-adding enzyme BshC
MTIPQSSKTSAANARSLPFAEIPGQSRLFLDYLTGVGTAKSFYSPNSFDLGSIAARRQEVLSTYEVDRSALCDALKEINVEFSAGDAALTNIELLREKDCLTVVTGQQAGLFTGPLYTVFKAISAIKLAEKLRQDGLKAVPVFWIAEEDHDFAEVSATTVIDAESKAITVRNTPAGYKQGAPVGSVILDESILPSIESLFAGLPTNENSGDLRDLIAKAYQPGVSFSVAFGRMMARLFEKYGLVILSPMRGGLKRLTAPIMTAAIENAVEINEALQKQSESLTAAGYHAQVQVNDDGFPFFYFNDDGIRQKCLLKNGKVSIDSDVFDISQLAEMARQYPERFSPNALMRPVVQDYLLPTLGYFGGAAEVAYFAQNSAVYALLHRPVTPIFHRASATIVEPHMQRMFQAYEIGLADLFSGREALYARITESFLNKETAKDFAEAEEIINTQLNRLGRALSGLDITLAESLAKRRRKILHHIGALRVKFHRAQVRKDDTANKRIDAAFNVLYPQNALQERAINTLSFLARHGLGLIDRLCEQAEIEGKQHQLIYL